MDEKRASAKQQHFEFCKKRLDELDDIVKEEEIKLVELKSFQYPKVQFIISAPPKLDSSKISEEFSNEKKPQKSVNSSKSRVTELENVVRCDMLLLVSALKGSGPNWLGKELETRATDDNIKDDGITILFLSEDKEDIEDLRFLMRSLTEWNVSDSSRLQTIVESGVGKALGFDRILLEEGVFEDGNDETKSKLANENRYERKQGRSEKATSEDSDILDDPRQPHHSHRCPDCNKSFSQKKLLNRHIRTIHQEHNPNTCQVCSNDICSSFSISKINLSRYMSGFPFIILNKNFYVNFFRYAEDDVVVLPSLRFIRGFITKRNLLNAYCVV